MFDIFTNYTIEDCNELTNWVNDFRYLILDAESAKSNLGSLTQMEQIISRLTYAIRDMEDENQILKQMAQALDKINYDYINTENRICENVEQSVIRYTRRDLKSVDLIEISSMLGDVTLE